MKTELQPTLIIPYDTTLRDGGQTPGVTLSPDTKIRIAERLDREGFPYIEGGWPGANPTDTDFFRQLRGHKFQHAQLVVFGMTGRVGVKPENDPSLQTLLEAETEVVTIFGKSWLLHTEKVLGTTAEANLESIYDSVVFLRRQGKRVFYDAEHFFDGYKNNSRYALSTLEAARSGGAETVILCDTNGGATPEFVSRATKAARRKLGQNFSLGIHVHNDRGLAVASTIAAVKAGATQVQGTINGAGERTGNVDLCVFIPTAKFSYGIEAVGIDLTKLYDLAKFVESENGLHIPNNHPFTGKNAFTHKGGVHVDAVRKVPKAYEHIDPKLVGRERSFESSDQGGGANIMEIGKKYGYELEKTDPRVREMVEKMKGLGVLGDAQEYLLLYEVLTGKPRPFEVLERSVTTKTTQDGSKRSATVIVKINGEIIQETATGNGPINAFDNALRNVIGKYYPAVYQVGLIHWAQPPTQRIGTDAEVVIRASFGANENEWTSATRGTDQQVTGENALIDSYNYYILHKI